MPVCSIIDSISIDQKNQTGNIKDFGITILINNSISNFCSTSYSGVIRKHIDGSIISGVPLTCCQAAVPGSPKSIVVVCPFIAEGARIIMAIAMTIILASKFRLH